MDDKQIIHPHHKTMHKVKKLQKSLLVVAVFFVIVIACLFVLISQMFAVIDFRMAGNDAKESMANIVSGNSTDTSKMSVFYSKLGFSLSYDISIYDVSAQSAGSNALIDSPGELSKRQDFSSVILKSKSDISEGLFEYSEFSMNTNENKYFWDTLGGQSASSDKMNYLVQYATSPLLTDSSKSITSTTDENISGIIYKKMTISKDNSKYGISKPTEDTLYITIQNDRPYWILLKNTNILAASQVYEQVLLSIGFHVPESTLLSRSNARAASSSIRASKIPLASFKLPSKTSNIPDDLDSDTLVDVVAKNQPAVVRILFVYCADITLKSGSESVVFKDSCSGGVGSGSFVSSDGYIATNGHVVTSDPISTVVQSFGSIDEVSSLLAYLVKISSMTQLNADQLISGLQSGDTDAQDALANIGTLINKDSINESNQESSYSIQLGHTPVRLVKSGSRLKAVLNDAVINARLIDKDFNYDDIETVLNGGSFTTSDIAILKVKGDFPVVKLGDLGDVKIGDRITAIGFPGFIDGSTSTLKLQTVPTVTQGRVIDINSNQNSNGQKVIYSDVQIGQGNSGGPAFDKNGLQIGLMTYGEIDCVDSNCFGNGRARDIKDLKRLLEKNNINLKSSSITSDWYRALDFYVSGDYSSAITLFDKIKDDYPANYLAPALDSEARDKLGGKTDNSSSFATKNLFVGILAATTVIGVLSLTGIMLLILHHRKKYKEQLADFHSKNTSTQTQSG